MDVPRLIESDGNSRHEAYIQRKIVSFKGGALIGVEYALETYENSGGICRYRCILCDVLTRNILSHFISYNHRMRYLRIHYPTVMRTYRMSINGSNPSKESRNLVQIMAEAIENYYGWLPVKSISEEEYYCDPNRASDDVLKSFHYDETMGPDFLDVIAERLQKQCDVHYKEIRPGETNFKFSLNRKFIVKNTESAVITLHHKWEKYRALLQERLMIIKALQAEYDRSPESHPLYSDEWDMFWVKRYKQLKAENKIDPKTYDYKPEWVNYWSKRMKELYNDEIQKAKADIKLSLGLSEEAEDPGCHYHRTSKSNYEAQNQNVNEHAFSSPRYRTRSPSPYKGNLQKYTYSRSRSRSPLQFSKYRDQTEISLLGGSPSTTDKNLDIFVGNGEQIRTLAVIDKSVNDCGITQMNWKKLEKSLTDALVEVLKKNHGPVAQFRDAGWYQGRIKLIEFKENRSPSLYRQALRSLGQIWPSARLDLTELSEIPNRPRASTRVPANPSRPCEILELIQQSNAELATYNWKIQKVSFDKGGFRQVNLTVNGKSVLQLRERNNIVRYGSDTIKIKIFNEDI